MMKNGISLDSIKQMSALDVAEYLVVLQAMQEAESDKMQSMGR